MTKSSAALIVAAIAVIALMFAGSGCSIGDYVQSKVPLSARKTEGLPAKLSHNDNIEAYRTWFTRMESEIARIEAENVQWQENILDSEYTVELVSAFSADALAMGEGALAGVPYGTIGVGLLTLFAGRWMKRPGEDKAVEAARKEGRDEQLNFVKEFKNVIGKRE